MYEFITGPFLWLTFIIFFGGILYKIITMVRLAKRDKIIPYITLDDGLRSIMHWLTPFGSRNMRMRPVMTIVSFLFHICLLVTPIFLIAHLVYLNKAWGLSWWTLPGIVADIMTLMVIAGTLFFFVRRLVTPEVQNVTSVEDYLILAVIFVTFATGFIAHHQLFAYDVMFILHILSGGLMLIMVPISRLSHIFYFFFTRAYMGSEFGNVRNARDW